MKKQQAPHELKPANLSLAQMKLAVEKVSRRIKDLQALEVGTIIDRGDPRIQALQHRVNDTLGQVFGIDSIEYKRYAVKPLDNARWNVYGTPIHEVLASIQQGKDQAIANLQTLIDLMQEQIQDESGVSNIGSTYSIGPLSVVADLEEAAGKLFRDGHFANAVLEGSKVLVAMVKSKSGRDDLDGTELMQTVFSLKTPILRFNDLKSETDRSVQQGMMFLYSGAIYALRNPRAHQLIQDDHDRALESLGFINLLLKALEISRR